MNRNAELGMWNAKWKMENGKWKMENAEWECGIGSWECGMQNAKCGMRKFGLNAQSAVNDAFCLQISGNINQTYIFFLIKFSKALPFLHFSPAYETVNVIKEKRDKAN